jgi:hypothetical protein
MEYSLTCLPVEAPQKTGLPPRGVKRKGGDVAHGVGGVELKKRRKRIFFAFLVGS